MAQATDIAICQTLVHEMCHLWQSEFGNPSRTGYHNKEWALKMESIGLMPSSTGIKGGRKVGQKMSDYPISNGLFSQVFNAMPKELLLPFKSSEIVGGVLFRNGVPVNGENIFPTKKKNTRAKYRCNCGHNIWAKPNIESIFCNECQSLFKEVK